LRYWLAPQNGRDEGIVLFLNKVIAEPCLARRPLHTAGMLAAADARLVLFMAHVGEKIPYKKTALDLAAEEEIARDPEKYDVRGTCTILEKILSWEGSFVEKNR
jgi:hypothetical protein